MAQKSDCKAILSLINELARYERAENEVQMTLGELEESGFGNTSVWWGFVAVDDTPGADGKVVGMAICYVRFSTWKGECAYLEDLIVTETYRGKGVGRQLFQAVLDSSRAAGFKRLSWQVLDWNEPAIGFYGSFGAGFDAGWVNGFIDL